MSQFRRLAWSLAKADAELSTFKVWLTGQAFIGETEIVREIVARENMCGLLAASAGFNAPDLIRSELALKGLFRTDLVLGNDTARQFVLVEFESASQDSLFSGQQTARYRPWSRRLEHGFGQVVDWAWLMADAPHDIVLTSAFGGVVQSSAFLVICGRSISMRDEMERRRFNHRRNAVRIDGIPARVMTYDDMIADMEINLSTMKSFSLSP